MSLNGILEAFHASSASPAQIGRQARWMMGSSVAFAVSLWSLANLRPGRISTEQCLVLASCASMVVRIIYAGNHALRYFANAPSGGSTRLKDILPHPAILAIGAAAATILRRLEGVEVLLATGAFGVVTLAVL